MQALKLLFSPLLNGDTCWNGRGGACVPARTSAQRRFHTQIYLHITYHARGLNDGCALAGRHGRVHRHHPYPSPSCFSVQSAHNQRPHRPRSYKNHAAFRNERKDEDTLIHYDDNLQGRLIFFYPKKIPMDSSFPLLNSSNSELLHHLHRQTCDLPEHP